LPDQLAGVWGTGEVAGPAPSSFLDSAVLVLSARDQFRVNGVWLCWMLGPSGTRQCARGQTGGGVDVEIGAGKRAALVRIISDAGGAQPQLVGDPFSSRGGPAGLS